MDAGGSGGSGGGGDGGAGDAGGSGGTGEHAGDEQSNAAVVTDPAGSAGVLVGACDAVGERRVCTFYHPGGCASGEQTCVEGAWTPCDLGSRNGT